MPDSEQFEALDLPTIDNTPSVRANVLMHYYFDP